MKYISLSKEETELWINDISRLVDLIGSVLKYEEQRYSLMCEQHKNHYLTGWRSFLYDNCFYISEYTGECFGWHNTFPFLSISSKKVTPYNTTELEIHINEDKIIRLKKRMKNKLTIWKKYAEKPFTLLTEDDCNFREEVLNLIEQYENYCSVLDIKEQK